MVVCSGETGASYCRCAVLSCGDTSEILSCGYCYRLGAMMSGATDIGGGVIEYTLLCCLTVVNACLFPLRKFLLFSSRALKGAGMFPASSSYLRSLPVASVA
uniref:Uncharacterized protein n=1 Tax=Trypanosoma congolense (strain IL3000) TaxID=1068625 RepID=G0V028_TRYCI|nr:hypothetical protein, unlikely [Trypanosoma congolense IL3000]